MKIEEYVPINMPIIKILIKEVKLIGPKNKILNNTKIVVPDVFTERAKVWFMLLPPNSLILLKLPLIIFSRMRSKTTIVSLTEYPKIVRIAATKGISN